MAGFTDTAKAAATATLPREFDISYSITLEDLYDKLNARASAFQMPFEIKGGIPGRRIAFEKEPNLDMVIWVYAKQTDEGTHIKVLSSIQEVKTTVNGMRVDKNSVLRRGAKGAFVSLPVVRGEYADLVTDTIKKILNGEEVEDYAAPAVPEDAPGAEPKKDWLVALLLCLFGGGLGIHRYYVGKIGTGILYTLTLGLFGIGCLVDLIKIICGTFTDKNGNPIRREK